MWKIYLQWHKQIEKATSGTDIPPEYMAAIISLESHPPGNSDSTRFEKKVFERLVALRDNSVPFGYLSRNKIKAMNDPELRELATSYGLTQIMGYHCLQLKCTIDELHSEDHLLWAIAYMQLSYSKYARKNDWESCFRIHNTGSATGKTTRNDYVDRGLKRMQYYKKWENRDGRLY